MALKGHATVGARGRPPQNGSLWHEDYSELKAVETLRAQETFFPSLSYKEESKLKIFPRIWVVNRDKFCLNGPHV